MLWAPRRKHHRHPQEFGPAQFIMPRNVRPSYHNCWRERTTRDSEPIERHIKTDKRETPAFSTSQADMIVPKDCKLRRVKYLNDVIEQEHRFIKKQVRASRCFKSFHTAERMLEGIEEVNLLSRLSG